MRTHKYPSDVSDAQWRLIEPLIPVYPGGRPRKTPLRDVVDAILYVLRTGCQWRYLPKDFPPKSTVYGTSRYGTGTARWSAFITHFMSRYASKLAAKRAPPQRSLIVKAPRGR